jgi:pimeloyl-ACP methyl ester carboxylesterase
VLEKFDAQGALDAIQKYRVTHGQFVPVMFTARYAPHVVNLTRRASNWVPRGLVPFWMGVGLDTLDHRADSMAAVLHGVIFGRVAPSSKDRREITAPVLVVGHRKDPIHPFVDADMLAGELRDVRFESASSILEWRFRPDRLNRVANEFVSQCWEEAPARRQAL